MTAMFFCLLFLAPKFEIMLSIRLETGSNYKEREIHENCSLSLSLVEKESVLFLHHDADFFFLTVKF